MTDWIYESPDGGRTVYRRAMGSKENREQMLCLDREHWIPMSEVVTVARRIISEQYLRNKYPMLQQLWDEYQTALRLIGIENT